jgi:hypothetical protein
MRGRKPIPTQIKLVKGTLRGPEWKRVAAHGAVVVNLVPEPPFALDEFSRIDSTIDAGLAFASLAGPVWSICNLEHDGSRGDASAGFNQI